MRVREASASQCQCSSLVHLVAASVPRPLLEFTSTNRRIRTAGIPGQEPSRALNSSSCPASCQRTMPVQSREDTACGSRRVWITRTASGAAATSSRRSKPERSSSRPWASWGNNLGHSDLVMSRSDFPMGVEGMQRLRCWAALSCLFPPLFQLHASAAT